MRRFEYFRYSIYVFELSELFGTGQRKYFLVNRWALKYTYSDARISSNAKFITGYYLIPQILYNTFIWSGKRMTFLYFVVVDVAVWLSHCKTIVHNSGMIGEILLHTILTVTTEHLKNNIDFSSEQQRVRPMRTTEISAMYRASSIAFIYFFLGNIENRGGTVVSTNATAEEET